MVPEGVWVRAVLSGLVEDRFQRIALVAALGKQAGQIRCREIPVTEIGEEFPYLQGNAGGQMGPSTRLEYVLISLTIDLFLSWLSVVMMCERLLTYNRRAIGQISRIRTWR